MQYKYRWVYTMLLFFIISSMGYVYDVKPHLAEYYSLQVSKEQLLEKLAIQKVTNQHRFLSVSKNKKMDDTHTMLDLVMLIQQNGLTINELQLGGTNNLLNSDHQKIHLLVSGALKNLMDLMMQLSRQKFSLLISNFNISCIEANKLSLSLDVILNSNKHQLINPLTTKITDMTTICADQSSNNVFFLNDISKLLTTPITVLKMIGYYQSDEQPPQALIELPNQTTITINKGSILAAEHGVVINIQPDYVLVELPNKQQMKLYLNNDGGTHAH